MVDALSALVSEHGFVLMFGLGFLEFIGFPIASVPMLVAIGSLAQMSGGGDPVLLIVAVAAGGLLADGLLFAITRVRGQRIIDVACGLTTNPSGCVLGVADRVAGVGGTYILFAKFIPGAGNLIGPAAALAGFGAVPFLIRDAGALLLWATAYTGLGWVFADQVESVLAVISAYTGWALFAAVGVVTAVSIWRVLKVRIHAPRHRARTTLSAEGAEPKTLMAPTQEDDTFHADRDPRRSSADSGCAH